MLAQENGLEHLENELNKGAMWGVVYGDFMSYMMIFFLVLFAFSLQGKNSGAPSLEESLSGIQKEFGGKISPERLEKLTRQKQEEDVSQKLETIIKDEGLQDVAKVVTSKDRVKLVLTAPVLFDAGKAEVKPEAANILFNVMMALNQIEKNEIVVEGHTDNVPVVGGPYRSNWDLSGARANSVVRLLVQWGLDPRRLTATGYGEYRPAGPNDTPEHKAQNRRIEISILRS